MDMTDAEVDALLAADVGYGLCECGCGQRTTIALESDAANGMVQGEPRRFVFGHTGHLSKKHGDANVQGVRAPEYHTWSNMKQRCLNPNRSDYARYGGRGITICQEWIDSYEQFLADMGRRPTLQHSIDRIDNDGNYEPSNCRWATLPEQRSNQRRVAEQGNA